NRKTGQHILFYFDSASDLSYALSVSVKQSSLQVVQGDSVTLACSFLTSGSLTRLNVIWTLVPLSHPQNPKQVIAYDHGQVIEDPSLIGRVGFTGLPTRADIRLNDTRVSDAGTYCCMVNNPPDTPDPAIGELQLSILAPPSLPVCQWDGDIAVGGNVLLSCSVSEGSPPPEIHWAKMDPEEVSLPVNMEGGFGSTHISNVSSQTSGLYRCSASNELGTENCYVNLSVYTTPDAPSGVLQAVLLTLTMTLVLLVLLVLIMWLHHTGQDGRWREGGKEEEEEEEGYNEIRYTPSLMKLTFV
uniref:Immunoglobulin superfamily member 11-like n=1 Tax=Gouania willdenowi TaxID=441366 RepID=A0A8C5HMC6_GOUWI